MSTTHTNADVAKHNQPGDLWVIISGKVYDVTGWLQTHPGGPKPLLNHGGKDATPMFHLLHKAGTLDKYAKQAPCVGTVANVNATSDKPANTSQPISANPERDAMYKADDKHGELFKGIQRSYPWSVYFLGFFHFAIYASLFVPLYFLLYKMSSPWHIVFVIPFGWVVYCVWMIGHESYHYTIVPADWQNTNLAIAYLTMDCLVTSRENWYNKHHTIHHGDPWSEEPQDRQRLFGPFMLVELINVIFTVLGYWFNDFADLVSEPSQRKFLALVVRFTWLFSLPLNAIIGTVFCLGSWGNYLGLMSHSIPNLTPTDDEVLQQMRTSIDIFPHNMLGSFLFGSLNNHGVHHLFPALPRSLHKWGSDKLRKYAPDEYRYIDTFPQLLALWVCRDMQKKEPVPMKDLTVLAKGRYAKKLSMDLFSVVVCCLLVAYTPAIRILDLSDLSYLVYDVFVLSVKDLSYLVYDVFVLSVK